MRPGTRLSALAGTALAALLIAGGTPARGATLEWKDAVDDAVVAGPASQATLDITKVNLNFDGKTLKATLDIKKLGDPAPLGTGQYFAVRWMFSDKQYTLRLTQDRVAGNIFQFQERTDDPGGSTVATIACRTCKANLDIAKSQVQMQIGMDSLTSAMKKLKPGSAIESLTAFSGAAYSAPTGPFLWSGAHDSAPAPAPATFTF